MARAIRGRVRDILGKGIRDRKVVRRKGCDTEGGGLVDSPSIRIACTEIQMPSFCEVEGTSNGRRVDIDGTA